MSGFEATLQTVVISLIIVALVSGTSLYSLNNRACVNKLRQLVLRLLSYPLTILCITIIFAFSYVTTIAQYTLRRIDGPLPTGFKLRVSFDD